MKAIVIGGGASGFLAAITCCAANPEGEVIILEKSPKLLSKVKISGGGRCNVTNNCEDIKQFASHYPRGGKELSKCFSQFFNTHIIKWFEQRGVKLKTESDGRVFPVSNNSQTVIDCLVREARVLGVKIFTDSAVKSIKPQKNKFELEIRGGVKMQADKILIATGGNPNIKAYQFLIELGHAIIAPVPSLFTFNIPNFKLVGLEGIAIKAKVRLNGHKIWQDGPVLITHWGLSGPAILKLSAWEARNIGEKNYDFGITVNWLPEHSEASLRTEFEILRQQGAKKVLSSYSTFDLPRRFWERLCYLASIETETRWAQLGKKSANVLIQELINQNFRVKGKTLFKEEFVTAGGVRLSDVNTDTMESKLQPGLYFSGEILDIDGITGGFNFQSAWTTGYIAGKNMAHAMFRK